MATKSNDKILDEAFAKLGKVLKSSIERVILYIGEDCLKEAQVRTPVDTGHLRGSGQAKRVIQKKRVFSLISFNTNYALKVHEGTYNLGPRSRAAGAQVGPKYLTRAAFENRVRYTDYVRKSIAKDIKNKFK